MQDRTRVTLAFVIAMFMIGLTAWTWQRTRSQNLPILHVGDPVTEEECLQLARLMEEAVKAGDSDAFLKLLDYDLLVEQATVDAGMSAEERQAFLKQSKISPGRRNLFQRLFRDPLGENGSFKFLRTRTDGGEKRILFRLIRDNGDPNYLDLLAARRPDGQVRTVDVFSHWLAESSVQTLRRFYRLVSDQGPPEVRGGGKTPQSESLGHLTSLGNMVKAYGEGRFEDTIRFFHQLPPALQQHKNTLFFRFEAAQEVGEGEYLAAVEDLRKYLPADPCLDLVSLGYFRLKNQYKTCQEIIDRVEKRVGGDPYLHVLRAWLHFDAEELDLAQKLGERAIEEEPTLENAYWVQVNVALRRKQFDEVVRLLTVIENQFGDDFDDFTKLPDYAEFVKSPQYEKWINRKNKRG